MARYPCWNLRRLTFIAFGSLTIASMFTVVPAAEDRPDAGTSSGGDNLPFRLAFIPRDAILVLAVRPATLLEREPLVPLREVVSQFNQRDAVVDMPFQDMSESLLVLLPSRDDEPGVAVTVRARSPEVMRKSIADLEPWAEPVEYAGRTYRRTAPGLCFFQPDDRSVIFSWRETTLRRCIAAGPAGARTANWASRWEAVATADAAALLNTALLRAADPSRAPEVLRGISASLPAWNRHMIVLPRLAPLWQNSEQIEAELQVSEEIALRVLCQSASEDEARQVHSAMLAAVATTRALLSRQRESAAADDDENALVELRIIDLADEILERARMVRHDSRVQVTVQADESETNVLKGLAPRMAIAVQQSSSRRRSSMNLKRIALAMHKYHDVHTTFPAAVQLGPKNIPRTWRVTILPFLGQELLYQQYRQDEPWDSENNKRVLAAMPEVYANPLDRRESTNTSYFVLAGRDSVFPGNRTVSLADITDGTSNTLLVVECKRDVPWTKPEDIPFDAAQPLPKLGGWYPRGFNAARCDGAIQFLSHEKLDEQTLRYLVMRSDGNLVQIPY